MKVFVGIEGGASFSNSILVQEDGTVLAEASGLALNYLLDGLEVVFQRIADHIAELKRRSAVEVSAEVASIGLCLSGCEDEAANRLFEKKFRETFPGCAGSVTVASDVIGSIKTCAPGGGVVLIAGTGSNCFVLNPDSSTARCGGWGHLLGDEGSGYTLAQRGIKSIIDHDEKLRPSPYDVEPLRQVVLTHFDISSSIELLPFFYTDFRKPFIAQLAKKMSELARSGDKLCAALFRDIGVDLARHVRAVSGSVSRELRLERKGGLPIICVGSVFLSWDLMCEGFTETLRDVVDEFTCFQPVVNAAIGAAYHGATLAGHSIPVNFANNYRIIYEYDGGRGSSRKACNGDA